jgi:6-phosphogluconate dehydrogenase
LPDLTATSLAEDPVLSKYLGVSRIRAMGAERSTRQSREALLVDVLFARFPSHHKEGNTNKLLSAIPHAFGGHVEPR